MASMELSGNINITIPDHDYHDAIQSHEQTAEYIKSKYTWKDGLTLEYTIVAGQIDIKTNGHVYVNEDNSYIIKLN